MTKLIPAPHGTLTTRRTDTLLSITKKLLASPIAPAIKGIHQMSDDELWDWWCGLTDEWRFLFLQRGLGLELWDTQGFDENYDYTATFDWLDKTLVWEHLQALTRLTELDLSWSQISDVTPLANLTQLTELDLSYNQISDITPLANLTQLTRLWLESNEISDITPLANLTQLTRLWLESNEISDITPLANLTQLTELDLSYNQISDFTPLANLTQLTWLNLRGNQISEADIDWLRTQLPNCDIDF